jgi:putative flippase GtrA
MTLAAITRDRPAQSRLLALFARLPRPLRFLGVGAIGLTTDVGILTLLLAYSPRPLLMRLFSLGAALFVTWQLNRLLTFDRSGRPAGEELLRYTAVAIVAQSASYAVYAALVLTVLAWLPQAAAVAGAVIGAVIAYNGHRLFAFAPRKASS